MEPGDVVAHGESEGVGRSVGRALFLPEARRTEVGDFLLAIQDRTVARVSEVAYLTQLHGVGAELDGFAVERRSERTRASTPAGTAGGGATLIRRNLREGTKRSPAAARACTDGQTPELVLARIAEITGERWRTVELTRDGRAPRFHAGGEWLSYESGAGAANQGARCRA